MSANRQPRVEGFVPFLHVEDLRRSVEFYERFGFEVRNSYEVDGQQVWCWLERHQARVMLAQGDVPVPAEQQFVLFYVYAHDLGGLHEELIRAGLEPGPIEPGAPGPDRRVGQVACSPDVGRPANLVSCLGLSRRLGRP